MGERMMFLVFETGMVLSVIGLIVTFSNGMFSGSVAFKAMASLFFVLAGACAYIRRKDKQRFFRIMLFALICSMVGDVFLALDQGQGILFVLGVASFAAAHVLFSVAFCSVSAVDRRDFAGVAVVFLGLLLLLLLGNFQYHGMLPVLILYSVVISVMSVKAVSLWRCRQNGKKAVLFIMAGGVLFLLSDIVLLFWLFGVNVPKLVQIVNWIIYYMAQGCLTAAMSVPQFHLCNE